MSRKGTKKTINNQQARTPTDPEALFDLFKRFLAESTPAAGVDAKRPRERHHSSPSPDEEEDEEAEDEDEQYEEKQQVRSRSRANSVRDSTTTTTKAASRSRPSTRRHKKARTDHDVNSSADRDLAPDYDPKDDTIRAALEQLSHSVNQQTGHAYQIAALMDTFAGPRSEWLRDSNAMLAAYPAPWPQALAETGAERFAQLVDRLLGTAFNGIAAALAGLASAGLAQVWADSPALLAAMPQTVAGMVAIRRLVFDQPQFIGQPLATENRPVWAYMVPDSMYRRLSEKASKRALSDLLRDVHHQPTLAVSVQLAQQLQHVTAVCRPDELVAAFGVVAERSGAAIPSNVALELKRAGLTATDLRPVAIAFQAVFKVAFRKATKCASSREMSTADLPPEPTPRMAHELLALHSNEHGLQHMCTLSSERCMRLFVAAAAGCHLHDWTRPMLIGEVVLGNCISQSARLYKNWRPTEQDYELQVAATFHYLSRLHLAPAAALACGNAAGEASQANEASDHDDNDNNAHHAYNAAAAPADAGRQCRQRQRRLACLP